MIPLPASRRVGPVIIGVALLSDPLSPSLEGMGRRTWLFTPREVMWSPYPMAWLYVEEVEVNVRDVSGSSVEGVTISECYGQRRRRRPSGELVLRHPCLVSCLSAISNQRARVLRGY